MQCWHACMQCLVLCQDSNAATQTMQPCIVYKTHLVTLQGEEFDLPLRLCLVTPLKREERALSTRPAATPFLPCLSTLEAQRLFLSPEAAYDKCSSSTRD